MTARSVAGPTHHINTGQVSSTKAALFVLVVVTTVHQQQIQTMAASFEKRNRQHKCNSNTELDKRMRSKRLFLLHHFAE
jgi:hypothetical protein